MNSWADPQLGRVPYLGEYEPFHEPPPNRLKRNLPANSQLQVSYYHAHIIHESQVCGTMSDAEFEDLLKQQAIKVTKQIPSIATMMSHDEYRVMRWTQLSIAAVRKDASPSEVLTHNARVCSDAIVQANAQTRILT